ncbi:MAG: methylglyoxal synthase [Oscillospiraceae bacterium]|nr:methylglyoxal synthase [Oscillospiraceae bacterium]MCL2530816.1 methylglyoxal synthase [Oscillospiraceae bacterium]
MNIALIASDTKKELISHFCIAYAGVFGKHTLFATGSTGRMIQEAAGLEVHLLYPGTGGVEQVESMVSCDEIDLVMLFRNGLGDYDSTEENNLLRLCDVHNIPVATNIATAEALIHALERGDLDWREMQKANRKKIEF